MCVCVTHVRLFECRDQVNLELVLSSYIDFKIEPGPKALVAALLPAA